MMCQLRVAHNSSSLGISELYPGPYRSFYPWDPVNPGLPCDAVSESYDYLTEVLEEKQYDGVIGFSQGGALAASYILHNQNRNGMEPVFRFAVFMCATLPWDATGTRRLRPEDLSAGGTVKKIDIPTLHLHGARDSWLPESRELTEMCKASEAAVFEHELGHTVPVDRRSTVRLADLVRDIMRRAMFKQ